MLLPFLQTTTEAPSAEELEHLADSAKATLQHFAEDLARDPNGTIQGLLEDLLHFGIKVVVAILIYIAGAWLIKKIRKMIANMFARRKADPALATFVGSFTSIALTIILIIITISTLGINTTSLAALLAAGGMAIGMAMSGTVQNFAGGIMILAFKPFKVGDFIEVQGYTGTVKEVTIVNTTLTTADNKSILIPNGTIVGSNINNYSRNPLRRVDWEVGVEYGADAEVCKSKLMELVKSDPRVIDSSTPGAADPVVVLSRLGDSAVVFSVRAWVKTEDYWDVFFKLNDLIYTELPKAGIQFPFPQLDVHVHKES